MGNMVCFSLTKFKNDSRTAIRAEDIWTLLYRLAYEVGDMMQRIFVNDINQFRLFLHYEFSL